MHNPVVHFEMLSKDPAKLSSFYEKNLRLERPGYA
jgi:predicted enzyme related to lactoylglutathione lyase